MSQPTTPSPGAQLPTIQIHLAEASPVINACTQDTKTIKNNELDTLCQKHEKSTQLDQKLEATISTTYNYQHRMALQGFKKMVDKKRKKLQRKIEIEVLDKEVRDLEMDEDVSEAEVARLQGVWEILHNANFPRKRED